MHAIGKYNLFLLYSFSKTDNNNSIEVGYDMAKRAADKAYAKAGIKPSDVQVVELHGNLFLKYSFRDNILKSRPVRTRTRTVIT